MKTEKSLREPILFSSQIKSLLKGPAPPNLEIERKRQHEFDSLCFFRKHLKCLNSIRGYPFAGVCGIACCLHGKVVIERNVSKILRKFAMIAV